jgi:c(7)-type cytochrome triheme protein
MSNRWFLLVILLFTRPDASSALEMMGGFVDEVYLQTRTVGQVTFSHSVHGTDCGQCHPKIFIRKNNSNHATMKAMEKGKSCGACHNGKKTFSVTGNCVRCHAGDIVYQISDPGNATFPHAAHIEAFACDECHPERFKAKRGANKATMAEMEQGKSCGGCHNGSEAFNVAEACESCHRM